MAQEERGWDFGLADTDVIAFVKCVKAGDAPIDWKASDLVQYISVKELRQAFKDKKVIMEKPKGAEEGFEMRVTWPSAIASADGNILEINSDRIKFKRKSDGWTCCMSLKKKEIKLNPLVKEKEDIREEQVVASVVNVVKKFNCEDTRDVKYYSKMLQSSSLSDRYAAAKALSNFPVADSIEMLQKKMADEKDHIYIRLEAASSILKTGSKESLSFFKKTLNDSYLENRFEAVIILGEIKNKHSSSLLIDTLLDKNQNAEIRAGAAWALGEINGKEAIEALITAFDETDIDIKTESARALYKLAKLFNKDIIDYFLDGTEDKRAGISWALSESGEFSMKDLISVMKDDNSRKWVSWIIGTQREEKFISEIEVLKKKDPEVYFAVTVLWKILSSWINGLELY